LKYFSFEVSNTVFADLLPFMCEMHFCIQSRLFLRCFCQIYFRFMSHIFHLLWLLQNFKRKFKSWSWINKHIALHWGLPYVGIYWLGPIWENVNCNVYMTKNDRCRYIHYISKICYLIKQTSGCSWCLFTNERLKVSKIFTDIQIWYK
jgi:hypothetical protein